MPEKRIAGIALLVLLSVLPARPQGNILSDAKDFVFFADFVVGAGWSFQVAVSNNSPTDFVTTTTAMVVDVNHETAVSWEEALADDEIQFVSIPPGGTRIYDQWPGTLPGEVVRGGVIVLQLNDFPPFQRDTQMLSAVLTYRNDASGIEVTVPPLGVDELTPPFFNDEVAYSIFVEETDAVTTGLALWKNPENEVCMWLDGLNGRPFQNPEEHDTICYSPSYGDQFSNSAGMLPGWFPSWDFSEGFQGRLVVAVRDNTFGPKGNDGLVIPMGLRVNRVSGAISAVPVVPVAVGRAFKSDPVKSEKPSTGRLLRFLESADLVFMQP